MRCAGEGEDRISSPSVQLIVVIVVLMLLLNVHLIMKVTSTPSKPIFTLQTYEVIQISFYFCFNIVKKKFIDNSLVENNAQLLGFKIKMSTHIKVNESYTFYSKV